MDPNLVSVNTCCGKLCGCSLPMLQEHPHHPSDSYVHEVDCKLLSLNGRKLRITMYRDKHIHAYIHFKVQFERSQCLRRQDALKNIAFEALDLPALSKPHYHTMLTAGRG